MVHIGTIEYYRNDIVRENVEELFSDIILYEL